MDSGRPRKWENIDVIQLSDSFRKHYPTLIGTLTENEVREIVSRLYSRGYIRDSEKETINMKTNTPTDAATNLIDIVKKKNKKEMYCAVLEILESPLQRNDLVTALSSFGQGAL